MISCLVIDDSKMIRTIHAHMLTQLGLSVTTLEDGQDALDQCRTAMPDLILVDWNMPKMDGLTFVKTVRQLPNGQRTRIILCSIENHPDQIARAIAAGADEYITKPFNAAALTEKLGDLGCLPPT